MTVHRLNDRLALRVQLLPRRRPQLGLHLLLGRRPRRQRLARRRDLALVVLLPPGGHVRVKASLLQPRRRLLAVVAGVQRRRHLLRRVRPWAGPPPPAPSWPGWPRPTAPPA